VDAPGFDRVSPQLQRTQRVLSTLSYRSGELVSYLDEIARAVSELIEIDWSAVTLCRGDRETVLASTIELGGGDHVYALHGTVTQTVVRSGDLLAVEDTAQCESCIEVRNGGNVIPPDLLSRLTEPFRTTKPGGSGLGLAIVKRIVDAHEGTLTISSSADAGTRVSVCLPAGGERETTS